MTQDMLVRCTVVGQGRTDLALKHRYGHKEGKGARTPEKLLKHNVDGACSEKAFAEFMGWDDYWPTFYQDVKDARHSLDVKGWEVRCTPYPPGRLIIQPADARFPDLPHKDQSPFVLVIVNSPTRYRVVGWCWGWEARVFCPKPFTIHFGVTHNVEQEQLHGFDGGMRGWQPSNTRQDQPRGF